jgi:hypothetical protein
MLSNVVPTCPIQKMCPMSARPRAHRKNNPWSPADPHGKMLGREGEPVCAIAINRSVQKKWSNRIWHDVWEIIYWKWGMYVRVECEGGCLDQHGERRSDWIECSFKWSVICFTLWKPAFRRMAIPGADLMTNVDEYRNPFDQVICPMFGGDVCGFGCMWTIGWTADRRIEGKKSKAGDRKNIWPCDPNDMDISMLV